MAHARDLLVDLVALAREEHDVATPRLVDRGEDRHLPLLDGFDGPAHAAQDLLDDRLRLFRPRVVAGDDHVVREARGGRAHHRALARIAIAAAAENADEAPLLSGRGVA